MNFSSFIISKRSIIGRRSSNVSDLMGKDGISLEMKKSPGDRSLVKDDSFFRTDDPDVDPVTINDVLEQIPFGRFHWIMIVMYFILFLSTSTLAFNFAFFLMPQSYLCPTSLLLNTTTSFSSIVNSEIVTSRLLFEDGVADQGFTRTELQSSSDSVICSKAQFCSINPPLPRVNQIISK